MSSNLEKPALELYVPQFDTGYARQIVEDNLATIKHTAPTTRYMVCCVPSNARPTMKFLVSVYVVRLNDLSDILPMALEVAKKGGTTLLLSFEDEEFKTLDEFFVLLERELHNVSGSNQSSSLVVARAALKIATVAFLMTCRHMRNHPTTQVKHVHSDEVKY